MTGDRAGYMPSGEKKERMRQCWGRRKNCLLFLASNIEQSWFWRLKESRFMIPWPMKSQDLWLKWQVLKWTEICLWTKDRQWNTRVLERWKWPPVDWWGLTWAIRGSFFPVLGLCALPEAASRTQPQNDNVAWDHSRQNILFNPVKPHEDGCRDLLVSPHRCLDVCWLLTGWSLYP